MFLNLLGEKQKEKEKLERQGSISSTASSRSTGTCNSSAAGSTIPTKHDDTWIHEIFEGTLTNETRCLSCETVSIYSVTVLTLHLNYFHVKQHAVSVFRGDLQFAM